MRKVKLDPPEGVRLYELTKEEFRDVTRYLRPDYTDEQYEHDWNEFQEFKRNHQRTKKLQ